ncbi:TRAP transporter small permease [Corynebacterium sp. YIM 101645]|uniref:TRAP transporter small permease n=1 Tax=Corynebacterium lemuris TaxID=1859292 RepID=A0ABT2FUG5_9CORY|nr:TRAP transporter small permease [Corynebacterium lemuris]MCS5478143.1 TRAP transporter small permease [Corynebacterium lemuris]
MVLLVSYDVLMRNLFGSAMTGVAEYVSEWLMPATVLFALAYTEHKNEHIRVTIIEDSLKGGPQKALRVMGQLTSVAVALVLTWASFQLAVDSFTIRETVPMGTALLTVWPIKVAVFAGWLWLSVQTIANLIAVFLPAADAQTHPRTDGGNLAEHGNEGGSGA